MANSSHKHTLKGYYAWFKKDRAEVLAWQLQVEYRAFMRQSEKTVLVFIILVELMKEVHERWTKHDHGCYQNMQLRARNCSGRGQVQEGTRPPLQSTDVHGLRGGSSGSLRTFCGMWDNENLRPVMHLQKGTGRLWATSSKQCWSTL